MPRASRRSTPWAARACGLAATVLVGAAVVGCGSSSSAGGGGSSSSGSNGGLKLGVVIPLTGETGTVGSDGFTGTQLAIKQANASGGIWGHPVTYQTEDTTSVPADAALQASKLAGDSSIKGLIGPIMLSEDVAVAPVAKRAGIVAINPAGAGVAPSSMFNGWIFRVNEAQRYSDAPLLNTVVKRLGNVKQIAILSYNDNQAYVLAKNIWTAAAKKLGISVINIQFPSDTQDYGPIVSQLQGKSVQALFFGAEPPTLGPLIKQIRAAGINAPIVGDASLFDPQVISVSGGAAAGGMSYGTYIPTSKDPVVRSFVAAYKKEFGKVPSTYAALAYDTTNLLLNAAKQAGPGASRQKIRDELAATRNYHGVTGSISYGSNGGDAVRGTIGLVQLTPEGTVEQIGVIPAASSATS